MLKTNEFWILTAAGALAIALAVVNMTYFMGNRELQKEASQRAQYIQQSISLENLYREIVQGLAERGLRTRDEQIRNLLAGEGINLNFETNSATRENQP
jgi:type VI protein secretion system component VasK